MISALFVQKNGPYWEKELIDAWDIDRDARKYIGTNPVIAHPPCQLWGNMAIINYKRWGGEHNKPGNDNGCFLSAFENVNRCGGVLEHPAKTKAFEKYGILNPSGIGWQKSGIGWVCEVWQSAYGHRANKATWLYYVGVNSPFDLNWERPIGSHQIGYRDQRGKHKNKPTLSKREANATPEEFKNVLIALAYHSKKKL